MEPLQNSAMGDSRKAMTGNLRYSPSNREAVLKQIPPISQKLNTILQMLYLISM
jgi:hypothetical protein